MCHCRAYRVPKYRLLPLSVSGSCLARDARVQENNCQVEQAGEDCEAFETFTSFFGRTRRLERPLPTYPIASFSLATWRARSSALKEVTTLSPLPCIRLTRSTLAQ